MHLMLRVVALGALACHLAEARLLSSALLRMPLGRDMHGAGLRVPGGGAWLGRRSSAVALGLRGGAKEGKPKKNVANAITTASGGIMPTTRAYLLGCLALAVLTLCGIPEVHPPPLLPRVLARAAQRRWLHARVPPPRSFSCSNML